MTAVSIEGRIFENLKAKLATLSWARTVEYDLIRVNVADFRDQDIPAIQFFDNKANVSHQRGDIKVEWSISIELVLKSSVAGIVSQLDLMDKKQEIEDLIGANVDLGLTPFKHLRYDGWETDATTPPFLVCRLDFSALYDKSFTGC